MEYPTQDLLHLAYAAQRINKGYVKTTRRYSEGQPTTFANKELITLSQHLDWRPADFAPLEVTDEDREAKVAGDKHMRRYTMLAMGDLPQFEADIFTAYCSDSMPIQRVGLIAYIPEFINRQLNDKLYKLRMKSDFAESAHFKDNVTEATEVEILRTIPLNSDFMESAFLHFGAIGKDLVCFVLKQKYAVGETYDIIGRVKGHDRDRESGLPMTRLNYVKLRKQEL